MSSSASTVSTPSERRGFESQPPKGTLVVKMIKCGKSCSSCPHGPYAYLVTKKDGKQTWKYLGLAKDVLPTRDKRLLPTQEDPET